MISYRPHLKEDIPLRVEWLNNPKIKFYVYGYAEKENTSFDKQLAWFEEYEKDQTKSFFTILWDNTPIGVVGLTNIDLKNKKAKVFIMIGADEFRGRGIGKRAMNYIIQYGFREFDLHKISLEVFEENKSAIKCYESVGFQTEGILKDEDLVDGKYHSMIIMSVFNIKPEEFQAQY